MRFNDIRDFYFLHYFEHQKNADELIEEEYNSETFLNLIPNMKIIYPNRLILAIAAIESSYYGVEVQDKLIECIEDLFRNKEPNILNDAHHVGKWKKIKWLLWTMNNLYLVCIFMDYFILFFLIK